MDNNTLLSVYLLREVLMGTPKKGTPTATPKAVYYQTSVGIEIILHLRILANLL